jgi:hypothetical protein
MIKAIWKSTNEVCTTFRSQEQFWEWYNSGSHNFTAKKIGCHPAVDLRDIRIEFTGKHKDGDLA